VPYGAGGALIGTKIGEFEEREANSDRTSAHDEKKRFAMEEHPKHGRIEGTGNQKWSGEKKNCDRGVD